MPQPRAPRNPDLQWLDMVDFTPGIFSNTNLAGGNCVTTNNPCMASPDGTWQCRALPTGGLGPLPRMIENFGLTTRPDDGHAFHTITVCGFTTLGRVIDSPNTSDEQFEAHIVCYWEDTEGTPVNAHLWWGRERRFDITPSTEWIYQADLNDVGSSRARYAYFAKTRMNTATPTDPGIPVIVCSASRVASNDIRFTQAFPDPTDEGTTSTVIVGEDNPYVIMVGHQGRIVLGLWYPYGHGTDADLVTNENLLWTEVNDNTLVTSTPATVVPEIDQWITDICPMSANALLFIKMYGGGYVIQGDLSDPTISQLPNLPCPDGADYVQGVNTAKGFVYSGGEAGLFLWNGGDGAECISRQLDGDFAIGNNTLNGANGKIDRWMDLVLVPNNWVWDSTTESWWRIYNPSFDNITFWSTLGYKGQAVGCASSFFSATNKPMYRFQYSDLAYSWLWTSQPMWLSRERQFQVREGAVALSGRGVVSVGCYSTTSGHWSYAYVIVDDDTTVLTPLDISCDGQQLIVELAAYGYSADNYPDLTELDFANLPDADAQAPCLHRLYLGYLPDAGLGGNAEWYGAPSVIGYDTGTS